MAPAWLDSLSEDWVSQHGSDDSAAHLPPLKHNAGSMKQYPVDQLPLYDDNTLNILSERSANDVSISRQRLSSKSYHSKKGTKLSSPPRSTSVSSGGSVVHNTVDRKASPSRDHGATPEWKRRLVHGEVSYGEQRDLFASAAVGLQHMFKPPSPKAQAHNVMVEDGLVLPSSPPPYPERIARGDLECALDDTLEDALQSERDDSEDDAHPADITPSPSPRRAQREVKYKLNLSDSTLAGLSSIGPGETPSRIPSNQTGISHDAPSAMTNGTRKSTWQSVARNEDFSPILIGKQSNENGKIDFAPIDVPIDQLKQKLERLRVNQLLIDSQADTATGEEEESNFDRIETTEDFGRQGGFLNMRRGGRSADGSFQFRPLSPGLGVDTSEIMLEESLQASTPKQFPTVRSGIIRNQSLTSPTLPRAPFPSPDKAQRAPYGQCLRPENSPLKLFGTYDTFTNQTLLRRISQFEDPNSSEGSRASREENKVGESSSWQSPAQGPSFPNTSVSSGKSVSVFGGRDLEGYRFFEKRLPPNSADDSIVANKENHAPSASTPSRLSTPRMPSSGDESDLLSERRRHKSQSSVSSKHARVASASDLYRNPYSPARCASPRGSPLVAESSDVKRPRTSPSKDPTPKRRRTLHRSDVAYEPHASGASDGQALEEEALRSRQETETTRDKPDVIRKSRPILLPRSRTASRQVGYEETLEEAQVLEHYLNNSNNNGNHATGGSYLHREPRQSPEAVDGNRKPSMRTQDFVDQAAQIMAMIRSQVRPQGLTSVAESEGDLSSPHPDDPFPDSSSEPLDRPPSRQRRLGTTRQQPQEDAELASKLKRYQEISDVGDVISSSLRSNGSAQTRLGLTQALDRQAGSDIRRTKPPHPIKAGEPFVSDIPNVRISVASQHAEDGNGSPLGKGALSSGPGSYRSYPSASSRASDSRRTIMPESVSHLIPQRVGSMYLDQRQNLWVKRKGSTSSEESELPSEDLEEDPFGSIPDLSVDLTREMQNLRMNTARSNRTVDPQYTEAPSSPSRQPKQKTPGLLTLSPNVPLSPNVATLAREEFEKLDQRSSAESSLLEEKQTENASSHEEEAKRRRNATISFSSPVASFIQEVVAEDLDALEDDPASPRRGRTEETRSSPSRSPGRPKSALKDVHSQRGRVASRYASITKSSFVRRPVSRIDEQDEDSTVEIPYDDQRQMSIVGEASLVSHKDTRADNSSLTVLVSRTPAANALSVREEDSVVIGQNVGKLALSPMSEFTFHHPDQSFGLEVSYVKGPCHFMTGDGSKRVLSMTIRDLVERLSEAEPTESYWEDITDLDLHDKRLSSLHMLDEFCGKVATLDVSQNSLAHLSGIPESVRQLKISQNMLTELTSWDHLYNLQYVDVSGNELTSLSALKNLVHLRSIKADDNQLTSIEELDGHDGLLSLRVRGNLMEEVNFGRLQLDRLADLDLQGNQISSVRGLHRAPSLLRLNLGGNRLETFSPEKGSRDLRRLDLSDNDLTELDIGLFPRLQALRADRNRLSSLTGFASARRLDSLSLREQRIEADLDLSFLSTAYEVRKLFLSGNRLGTFEPAVDLLNLQLLELANCGLDHLPATLGQLMPNLRTLNLNFNALSDLASLRFVPRMKKLLVAGNRLSDSTTVMDLLTDFPHLTQLDVRDNPMTLGFYPPTQVIAAPASSTTGSDGSGGGLGRGFTDPFTLPEVDAERDESYARRLDDATKLRRRLHQVCFAASCQRLKVLDGLRMRRSTVLMRDALLEKLMADGLVPDWEVKPEVVPGAVQSSAFAQRLGEDVPC